MKPPTNKLHIPLTEKASPFFASPYPPSSSVGPNPSQLSPIPSAPASADTPHSQDALLRATSPKMLEAGGYFPVSTSSLPSHSGSSSGGSRLNRARMACRQGLLPGGVWRRVVMLMVFLGLGALILHRHGGNLGLPEKYATQKPVSYGQSQPDVVVPSFENENDALPIPAHHPSHSSPSQETQTETLHHKGHRPIDLASDAMPLEATTRERLEVWRNAPGGRGEVEGEVEMGGFMQWNLEECSTISEQHNTHMIQHSANAWSSLNRSSIHAHRMELITHLETLLDAGRMDEYGEGRGVVMVAGNADTLMRVKWSLEMFRSYGSKLPVLIYHFPEEAPAEDDPIRETLANLNAQLVSVPGQQKDAHKTKSYHLKALAITSCPFRHVLYLDSDSIPTRDPEYMFDAPNYKRLGVWMTPDYWKTGANNPIWAIMGVKCRNEWEMETGQMFIDKKRHLDVFLLVQYMLERHDFWFTFSDGDKDIFRWALLALRKRWAIPGRWVGAAALPRGTASGEFCAHTMLQHDSWGEPLFVHYNLLKQIPSGVGRGFSWGRTKQLPLFNTWPATPATARLGEPEVKPEDGGERGLGEEDCDMLADAGEDGRARAPAKEMVMRRAARERGVKVKYHGGWISALCIDLEYIDPRPQERQDEDNKAREAREAIAAAAAEESESTTPEAPVARATKDESHPHSRSTSDSSDSSDSEKKDGEHAEGAEGEEEEEPLWEGVVYPDWRQSPIEVVQWADDEHLKTFEKTLYDFGFKPSGPGF
ncbi:hypothetical protein L202_02608 [Cryptococcus amylolentus CBS 6039]|uniref:Uncharacterized protein n=2 Tax=Cryptococcus amylolentus TaxID=104669 RepID=A0A1E3HVK9_9TREE|nr:hypothetical protein L202_02608 [Cryptococcus amylolentus CBS 6039]ODN80348.1 hypothetical protein L202_02608 [Cryptococcus amylolentus CBS 6039]ODO08991.1 hypothetical protein I350_02584 [Cryptococcus amylolentus CBS 6273]